MCQPFVQDSKRQARVITQLKDAGEGHDLLDSSNLYVGL